MTITDILSAGVLDNDELKIARILLKNKKVTEEQLTRFVETRKKTDTEGKRYLGDILLDRGVITQDIINEFFEENNKLYLEFLEQMREKGFIRKSQYEKVMSNKAASKNVVSVLEELGIMTKASFTRQFAKQVNSLKLGEWLVAKSKVDAGKISDALAEQSVNNLEDYLVYHKIVDEKLLAFVKDKLEMF